jgi:hypothetical protein
MRNDSQQTAFNKAWFKSDGQRGQLAKCKLNDGFFKYV